MKPHATMLRLLCAALLVGGSALRAHADIPADSPDDLCAPAADPCVITQHYEVTAPGGVLDFGLRAVEIASTGRLSRSVTILCGRFSTATTAAVLIDTNEGGGTSGDLVVRARRACSGDGSVACLLDTDCSSIGAGTCTAGPAGTIATGGKMRARGNTSGSITLEAVGGIVTNESIDASGAAGGTDGGDVDLTSHAGSVEIRGKLLANSGPVSYGDSADAGSAEVTAALDIIVAAPLELSGGVQSGSIDLEAGRDLYVQDDITVNAGTYAASFGGDVFLTAGDRAVLSGVAGNPTRISANGGGGSYKYAYYFYPGFGGYLSVEGDSVYLGEEVELITNTSTGGNPECPDAYAGNVGLDADGGPLKVEGRIDARGRSRCGNGGTLNVRQGHGPVIFTASSSVRLDGKFGGYLDLSTAGPVTLDGFIGLRGRVKSGSGYYATEGIGGTVLLSAGDVTIGGAIMGGSDAGSQNDFELDVCRMRLNDGARIDLTHGEPVEFGFTEGIKFTVGESMSTAAGSLLATATNTYGQQGPIEIRYRDKNKPPVLLGSADPNPDLFLSPGLAGCPVCGNSEIDAGESCDDGNTASGDGCRNDCQDEGCIAATPGYPSTMLCDDADACTVDVCDPEAHACLNIPDCEEGVECTVDACVAGACEHTPVDALCDDANTCTDDLCNAITGCSHANLTGPACEDGDRCTLASDCQAGTCVASDPRHAEATKIIVKLRPETNDDRLSARANLPLSIVTADPSATGLDVELRDSAGLLVLSAVIPAAEFESQSGVKFLFRDKDGAVASANGIVAVTMKKNPATGAARISIRAEGIDLPGAAGQDELSLSLLFGTDPSGDDCITARRVPCVSTSTRTRCKQL